MKRKYLITFVLIILAIISSVLLIFSRLRTTIQSANQPISGIKFSGTITEFNNGCWADGVCSVKIGGKWVVAEIGGERPPNSKPEASEVQGKLIGLSFSQDTNKYIGKKAEVYAQQSENDQNYLTIYGNSNYYIKLLE